MICIKKPDGAIYIRSPGEPVPAREPEGTPCDPEIRKSIEEWFGFQRFLMEKYNQMKEEVHKLQLEKMMEEEAKRRNIPSKQEVQNTLNQVKNTINQNEHVIQILQEQQAEEERKPKVDQTKVQRIRNTVASMFSSVKDLYQKYKSLQQKIKKGDIPEIEMIYINIYKDDPMGMLKVFQKSQNELKDLRYKNEELKKYIALEEQKKKLYSEQMNRLKREKGYEIEKVKENEALLITATANLNTAVSTLNGYAKTLDMANALIQAKDQELNVLKQKLDSVSSSDYQYIDKIAELTKELEETRQSVVEVQTAFRRYQQEQEEENRTTDWELKNIEKQLKNKDKEISLKQQQVEQLEYQLSNQPAPQVSLDDEKIQEYIAASNQPYVDQIAKLTKNLEDAQNDAQKVKEALRNSQLLQQKETELLDRKITDIAQLLQQKENKILSLQKTLDQMKQAESSQQQYLDKISKLTKELEDTQNSAKKVQSALKNFQEEQVEAKKWSDLEVTNLRKELRSKQDQIESLQQALKLPSTSTQRVPIVSSDEEKSMEEWEQIRKSMK